MLSKQLIINPGAKLQITELDNDTPLFKISDNANATADPNSRLFSNLSAIDGQIYKTKWTRLLGTEVIVDDYGELVGTVSEHLVSDSIVKPVSVNRTDKSDPGVTGDEGDSKTPFLRKAISLAANKEKSR